MLRATAGVCAMLCASPALAAGTTSPAKATTIRSLSLTNTEDLDFGTIIAGTVAGTVRINEATGARTTTGGAIAAGGAPQRGEFVGAGRFGIAAFVTIGPSPALTNGTGGTMATTLAIQGGPGLRLFPGIGILTFRVGGTVNIGPNQQQGDYTGTYTMTVNYL